MIQKEFEKLVISLNRLAGALEKEAEYARINPCEAGLVDRRGNPVNCDEAAMTVRRAIVELTNVRS